MKHVIGGYFLVEGVAHAPWLNKPEYPRVFWSISDCIATRHPHLHLLPWVMTTIEQESNLKQELQLSDDTFVAASQYVDACFNKDQLGWPSVWLNVEAARMFMALFLKNRKNVKLCGIAIPEIRYQEAIDEYAPASEQDGETGVYKMLKLQKTLHNNASVWGYEILGSEISGDFHSFVCNGLENACTQELRIALNKHGLISNYDDAEKASDYTNLDSTGAEPVMWLPWLVFELPIVNE